MLWSWTSRCLLDYLVFDDADVPEMRDRTGVRVRKCNPHLGWMILNRVRRNLDFQVSTVSDLSPHWAYWASFRSSHSWQTSCFCGYYRDALHEPPLDADLAVARLHLCHPLTFSVNSNHYYGIGSILSGYVGGWSRLVPASHSPYSGSSIEDVGHPGVDSRRD